jgi:hypothetical protein
MLQAIRNVDYVILLCQNLGRMRDFYHETRLPHLPRAGGMD